jgi:hypothetical protein
MKLQKVIERALIDANFADELRYKAILGQRGGKGSDEWRDFMTHFAKDSDQLMNFTAMSDPADSKCTATTSMTMMVTSTAACTTTTTTLTTSIFCGGHDSPGPEQSS